MPGSFHAGHADPPRREHPHVILYSRAQEHHERGELVREAAVTTETPEGDPGLMLTEIAAAEGGIVAWERSAASP
jgi:hypothetical protein